MVRHLIVHKAGVTWPFCARVPTPHAESVVHAYRDDQNYPTTGIYPVVTRGGTE